jgi:hypothetical protein
MPFLRSAEATVPFLMSRDWTELFFRSAELTWLFRMSTERIGLLTMSLLRTEFAAIAVPPVRTRPTASVDIIGVGETRTLHGIPLFKCRTESQLSSGDEPPRSPG